MNISIVEATNNNLSILFEMNRQLMEDEQFDRPLSDSKLKERWNCFVSDKKYSVLLFESNSEIIGYAVIHMDTEPLYLRHFFVKREFRKKGYGTASFNQMMDYLCVSKIDLEVMSWNERGLNFWKSLGFSERCKFMTLNR